MSKSRITKKADPFLSCLLIGFTLVFGFPSLGASFLTGAPSQSFDELANQGGFYGVDEVPYAPSNLKEVSKAVVRVGDCSGVILSNTGLVVTNLHCIDECLRPTFEYEPQIDQVHTVKPDFFKVHRIHERVPKNLNCPKWIRNQFHIYDYQLSEPEFLWMGRGRSTHDERKIGQLSWDEVDLIQHSLEDVVLLRYKKHPEYPNVACAPISRTPVKPNQRVWLVGFPDYNKRENGRNAGRWRMSVSFGRMRPSIEADRVYQEYALGLPADQRMEFWKREKLIWEQSALLNTSADAYPGASGGLMMGSDGALAVIFSITKTSHDKYNGGSSTGYRLDHLLPQWERDLGSDVMNEILNCRPLTLEGSEK